MIDDLPRLTRAATSAVSRIWCDPSTGLPGPAFWETLLVAESARCARYRRPATVILAEAVGFEDLARKWGVDVARRGVSDAVGVLRAGCRTSDYVARLTDKRAGVLLTETDEIAAINMIERVRDRCDRALNGHSTRARMAFGWASPTRTLTLRDAVAKAEELLRREAAGG